MTHIFIFSTILVQEESAELPIVLTNSSHRSRSPALSSVSSLDELTENSVDSDTRDQNVLIEEETSDIGSVRQSFFFVWFFVKELLDTYNV